MFGHYTRMAELQAKHALLDRALAFAAGFRCGQNAVLSRMKVSSVPAIADWERAEAAHAVANGFTEAKEFAEQVP